MKGKAKLGAQLETFGILVEKLYVLVPPPNRGNDIESHTKRPDKIEHLPDGKSHG